MEATTLLLYSKLILIILLGLYTVIMFYYILDWIVFLWAWRKARRILTSLKETNCTKDELIRKESSQFDSIIEINWKHFFVTFNFFNLYNWIKSKMSGSLLIFSLNIFLLYSDMCFDLFSFQNNCAHILALFANHWIYLSKKYLLTFGQI